jgi:hypothetical protein
LRTQSATTTISHEVTVAGGVFAPGHLGELTQYLPFELVDDVLAQTRAVQRRLRDLPSRVGVYGAGPTRLAGGSWLTLHGLIRLSEARSAQPGSTRPSPYHLEAQASLQVVHAG